MAPTPKLATDIHSYANPSQVRVTSLALDWNVDFDKKVLEGSATLSIQRSAAGAGAPLILDTRQLQIAKVSAAEGDDADFRATKFSLGAPDKIFGAPLTIKLPASATRVRIEYATSPTASGLQWLEPSQTAGHKTPFMFSQAQAIHARSFIPLQDSPGVRITYTAHVRTPKNLLAVMGAEGNTQGSTRSGDYHFSMQEAIPPYLIAIAVGDLEFRELGRRSGVYAEPAVIAKAAAELVDTESMIEATESLYGPYRWGRYDLLILPPSFPFGGMENPRLTFATPTILAGDKSLVSLVAHELAHSWSGNLVTNATWSDFWLNEGFTVYTERRIIEAVYGQQRREMEAALGRRSLEREMAGMAAGDQMLYLDLKGRDPDDGLTEVAYEKGALFLRHLEGLVGRPRFDSFLRNYFDHHAFQSITTQDFLAYLHANLLAGDPKLVKEANLEEWVYEAGLPVKAPQPASDLFVQVEAQAQAWLAGKVVARDLNTRTWSTQEWLHFLEVLPTQGLGAQRLAELDHTFHLTESGNSELAFQWLLMAIRNQYAAADTRLEQFLTSMGRRKFVKPLFEELTKSAEGKERARAIYKAARPTYHPITVATIDAIVAR